MSAEHIRLLVAVLSLSLFLAVMACGREPPAETPPDSPLISFSEPSLATLITPSPISPPTESPAVSVPTETPPPSLPTAPPIPTPTLTPTPTETAVPTLTPTPAPTSTPTETPIPTPTPIPTATRTPLPTATPTPTPIADRPKLYEQVTMPVHMATASWQWQPWDAVTHPSIEIPFEIHNDPGNFSDLHGLYLILAISEISDTPFYFGIQTHVSGKTNQNTGKGVSSSADGIHGICSMPVYPLAALLSPVDTRGTS